MKHHYTDEELIEGLRQRRSNCIEQLYEEYIPVMRHYLKQNSGNNQDVDDLFQDTIIVVYRRCIEEMWQLECSLKTYFMAVARNLWLQRLNRKYRFLYQADCEMHEARDPYSVEEKEYQEEGLAMHRLFYKHLMELPDDCRRLLEMYCLKMPYSRIARHMDYKDEGYVKTRKYLCKKMLRRNIMNDPEYKQFINYEGKRKKQ
jgi:RNA polymerase sigma factor (sigma-70 family)